MNIVSKCNIATCRENTVIVYSYITSNGYTFRMIESSKSANQHILAKSLETYLRKFLFNIERC